MEEIKQRLKAVNIDIVGATLSIICGIHCVIFPLLLMIQPVLKNNFLFSEILETGIVAISLLIALTSFGIGYFRHQNLLPLALFSVSFLFILFLKAEVLSAEIIFMPVAGFLLAFAHLYNHRMLHSR